MGWFSSRKSPPQPVPYNPVPTCQIDLSQRYDIYCWSANEERVYENVLIHGLSAGLIYGYVNIESTEGARMMIPQHGIQLMCEHGTKPTFKVLNRLPAPWA